ncbi:hypothetical protein Pmani_028770 [Petrolisthes manimaculis]|uniref:Uncharacterized protein n=1 Tax=Petrolisthes manimaculis TaxID=1843537 RepID=A0AAE1P1E6_9EUCA|nr:hypothetical protein Pmani_028770 [Petrolisthes manimaculis]
MATEWSGLFVHPTLSIEHKVGTDIYTDNNNDGDETPRLYNYGAISFVLVLDALFEEYVIGRRSITDDQAAIYRTLEERLTRYFGLEGKACVLRFICELSQNSKLSKNSIQHDTITGELITLVFTPREDDKGVMKEYLEAQLAGQVDNPQSWYRQLTPLPPSLSLCLGYRQLTPLSPSLNLCLGYRQLTPLTTVPQPLSRVSTTHSSYHRPSASVLGIDNSLL